MEDTGVLKTLFKALVGCLGWKLTPNIHKCTFILHRIKINSLAPQSGGQIIINNVLPSQESNRIQNRSLSHRILFPSLEQRNCIGELGCDFALKLGNGTGWG